MAKLNTKKEGYSLIEKQQAIIMTYIDFEDLSKEKLKSFPNINEAISSPLANMNELNSEYIDESPIYDLYKHRELIQQDMTLDEVETFFGMK